MSETILTKLPPARDLELWGLNVNSFPMRVPEPDDLVNHAFAFLVLLVIAFDAVVVRAALLAIGREYQKDSNKYQTKQKGYEKNCPFFT